jgi:MraZ protein
MTQFVGTHFGKLDRKGRISVPAQFRAELEAALTNQIVLRVSHQNPCLEVRTKTAFSAMVKGILALEHFSEDRDDLETAIVADSTELKLDGEGRVVLPEALTSAIPLGESIAFMGKGERFEIWDEATARTRIAEAKARVLQKRLTLPGSPLNATPGGVS